MANMTALLAALANLPPVSGGAPLTPLPGPVNAPTDFNLPMSIAPPNAPPMAPSAPIDQSIIQQYLAMLGPAPVAPTPQPIGRLDRIAAALSGISAGIQGQGPQFAASLRAERERPQREFEARQQQYEQQRRQLGLRGFEAAQSAEERRQDRATREADKQYEREFNEFIRRNNITDQMAIEKMREARDITRLREQERIQDERLASQQKAQQTRDARIFASKFSAQGAKGSVAKELGDYYAGLTDQISDVAAKWESASAKANDIRAAREARLARGGGGGGGGGSSVAAQKALIQFEAIKQQVADAVARGDAAGEQQLRRTMNAAFNRLSRFPGQFELGYDQTGQWPYAKPKTGGEARPQPTSSMAAPEPGQMFDLSSGVPMLRSAAPSSPQASQPTAPTQKSVTSQQIRDAANKAGISFKEASKQFTDAGYRISL